MKMPLGLAEVGWKKAIRLTCVAVGMVVCVLGMQSVLRVGAARSLAKSSLQNGSLAAAGEAVRLSPDDPEAYFARAISLLGRQEQNLAVDDLRRAITLRPRDYKLWWELGTTLSRTGKNDAALAAMKEAQVLAPFYAGPHWDTALLLQKLGRQDEAFKEFRGATATKPALLPMVIEMAWDIYGKDCQALQRAVDSQTAQEQLAVAHFFIGKGKATEALGLIRSVNHLPYYQRRQFVVELLAAKEFAYARELWAGHRGKNPASPMAGTIDDGGFESGRLSDEPGFAWIVHEIPATSLSIDSSDPGNGENNLLIKWQGSSDASDEIISQLVLVEPNTRYRLSFMARAQELVTGGVPLITITDVSQKNEQRLAHSSTLPLGTSSWQNIAAEFTTTNATRAVRLGVQRQSCPERPCPIFGSLGLDDFFLSSSSDPNVGNTKQDVSNH
jgi:tetratricopeptide (TPR) repeat protein